MYTRVTNILCFLQIRCAAFLFGEDEPDVHPQRCRPCPFRDTDYYANRLTCCYADPSSRTHTSSQGQCIQTRYSCQLRVRLQLCHVLLCTCHSFLNKLLIDRKTPRGVLAAWNPFSRSIRYRCECISGPTSMPTAVAAEYERGRHWHRRNIVNILHACTSSTTVDFAAGFTADVCDNDGMFPPSSGKIERQSGCSILGSSAQTHSPVEGPSHSPRHQHQLRHQHQHHQQQLNAAFSKLGHCKAGGYSRGFCSLGLKDQLRRRVSE